MKLYERMLRPLFFSKRFYWTFASIIVLFLLSFPIPFLFSISKLALLVFVVIVLIDYISLFARKQPVIMRREMSERFSNGDQNPVQIHIRNKYPFRISGTLIDEVPEQFQARSFRLQVDLEGGNEKALHYNLRPVERGRYIFEDIRLFVRTPLQLVVRRITQDGTQEIKVLPSYLALRQYELLAYSSNLVDAGSKKIRKIGHSLEFEQIKEYVTGDDLRSINWKATARKGQLMVNNFTDERSQQIYCIIDKGRVMKMPFEEMSLLDYAINASLILLRVALIRQDRAGLITFDENISNFIPADRKASQMTTILETLYNQETKFMESNY
ncbi:MAG: DUF58 domain-containing protein, partial [Chitinophagaceae bacterium]|nr:DUF58 domain-containing protein [Chitinophagaceae bacterium]